MQRFSISFAAPVAALALAAVVAACSGSAAAPSSPASPAPSQAPTHAPVATPAPTASPSPTPAPSSSPQAQAPVKLDVFLGHDVSVVVTDRGAGLVDARSGKGADGMSVRWGAANVGNLDPKTIEVTWAGYPRDETIGLLILPDGDGVKLRFGQAAPYPNTDAMGADRVMVFTFADAIAAADVAVEFTTTDD